MAQPRDSRGRFASTFGVVVTVSALGVALAVGAGAEGGGVGAAAGAAAGVDTPTLSVEARAVRGKQRSERAERSLAARGLREELRVQRDSGSCAADARGQVRDFLATHRCQSVYWALLEVQQGETAAVVAIAWVEMVEPRDATALKTLVDEPGTGNVNQLPAPEGEPVVELVEPAYASRQAERLVVTVEAEPAAVTTRQKVLKAIAEQTADSAGA